MNFHHGEEVKWLSRSGTDRWMRGKVLNMLERGAVAVVKDSTGLAPRCIDAVRLQPVLARRQRFAGGMS